jgi:signal transduction histidine kinase
VPTGANTRSGRRSLRTWILSIALIPSLSLMLVGLGAAVYTGYSGYEATSESGKYSTLNGNAGNTPEARAVSGLLQALRDERRLTGEVIADPTAATTALQAQWATSDRAVAAARSTAQPIVSAAEVGALVAMRPKIIARQVSLVDAVTNYSNVIVAIEGRRSTTLSDAVADPRVVRQDEINKQLTDLTETLDLSDALAFSAFADQGMPSDAFNAYVHATGDFKSLMRTLQQSLPPDEAGALNQLTLGPDGEVVAVVQRSVLHGGVVRSVVSHGTGKAGQDAGTRMDDLRVQVPLPVPKTEWRSSVSKMSAGLVALQSQHLGYAAGIARDVGREQLTRALLGSLALLVFAVVVLLVSLAVSRALIGRLRRLQRETIELSRIRLPELVGRLRDGQAVDVDRELPPLDYGSDEIGQVADAFGEAQRTAVAAAAREAETRAGLRKVFLDIAHRSQAIVYRQLKVLDEAERSQEDPAQLELLFQLDHLATRARRHAENLIILAGGKAGRQWRGPVLLLQLIRSAISEAKDYARVTVTRAPDVTVAGTAAADLIHLLAELVDNATAFTPPSAGVEVRGNLVGRGLVIEIEDRGLGLEPSRLAGFNEMLLNPPDFQMMALADEPRLGLFVVARLAERHGIRVTLMDSAAYGGTTVVVLVPKELLVEESPQSAERLELAAPSRGGSLPPALQARPLEPTRQQPMIQRPMRPQPMRPVAVPAPPAPTALPLVASREQAPAGPWQQEYPAAPVQNGPVQNRLSEPSGDPNWPPQPSADDRRGALELPDRGAPLYDELSGRRASARGAETQRLAPVGNERQAPPLAPLPSVDRDERPELPRRVRQANLSPKLMDAPEPTPQSPPTSVDAETARTRMSALQRGTLRGRGAEPREY